MKKNSMRKKCRHTSATLIKFLQYHNKGKERKLCESKRQIERKPGRGNLASELSNSRLKTDTYH